jgi:hypothetical protein
MLSPYIETIPRSNATPPHPKPLEEGLLPGADSRPRGNPICALDPAAELPIPVARTPRSPQSVGGNNMGSLVQPAPDQNLRCIEKIRETREFIFLSLIFKRVFHGFFPLKL